LDTELVLHDDGPRDGGLGIDDIHREMRPRVKDRRGDAAGERLLDGITESDHPDICDPRARSCGWRELIQKLHSNGLHCSRCEIAVEVVEARRRLPVDDKRGRK